VRESGRSKDVVCACGHGIHNSLGHKWSSGLDVKQSPNAQDAFRPIPGLISCAGVTRSVGITHHAHAAQIAGLRSSQSHSLAAYGSAHHVQLYVLSSGPPPTTGTGTR